MLDGVPPLRGGDACGATPGDDVAARDWYGGDRWAPAGSPLIVAMGLPCTGTCDWAWAWA